MPQEPSVVDKIGEYLQYQRKKRGLSLAEFSKELSLDPSFLHRIEKGYYQSIGVDMMTKIASGPHMPLDSFLSKCDITASHTTLPTIEFFCKESYQFPDKAIDDLKTFIAFLQEKYKAEIAVLQKQHQAYWKK